MDPLEYAMGAYMHAHSGMILRERRGHPGLTSFPVLPIPNLNLPHIPRTLDVLRPGGRIVKRKDSRMVNMSEDFEGLRRHGDFLSLTKTERGRSVHRHRHNVGKDEEKSGNVTAPGSPDTITIHFPDMRLLTPNKWTLSGAKEHCNLN